LVWPDTIQGWTSGVLGDHMGNRKSLLPAVRLSTAASAALAVATLAGCSSTKAADAGPPVLTPLAPATRTTPGPGESADTPTPSDATTGTPSTAAPAPPAAPTFTPPRLAAALLKPSDLGPGWQVQSTPDAKTGADVYGWGCTDAAAAGHKINGLPNGVQRDMAKLMTGSTQTGTNFYYLRYLVFPDAASAQAAQAALESQKQSCAGTHHVARSGDQNGHTDTDDFSAFSASGFTGQRLHEVQVEDGDRGVNEIADIEARCGNVLVVSSYTHFVKKDSTHRHADFTAESDRLIKKSLASLAAAAG
jgi:hypothetical protein